MMHFNRVSKMVGTILVLGAAVAFVAAGSEQNEFPLKGLEAGKLYGITVSIDSPYRLGGNGEIEASIRSKTVAVSGSVTGDIVAATKVVLHKTARVQGNITTGSLVVEDAEQCRRRAVRVDDDEGRMGRDAEVVEQRPAAVGEMGEREVVAVHEVDPNRCRRYQDGR